MAVHANKEATKQQAKLRTASDSNKARTQSTEMQASVQISKQ